MALSDLAERVLIEHARTPDRLRYVVRALGSGFYTSDLAMLDAAYDELVNAGLIERSPTVVSFFGDPKHLYSPTESGLRQAAKEPAA